MSYAETKDKGYKSLEVLVGLIQEVVDRMQEADVPVPMIRNKLIAEMMNSGYIPRLRVISSIMRAKLIGIIQFDMNINISTNLGQPIVLKKGTYIQQNFENICDRLIEEEGR